MAGELAYKTDISLFIGHVEQFSVIMCFCCLKISNSHYFTKYLLQPGHVIYQKLTACHGEVNLLLSLE